MADCGSQWNHCYTQSPATVKSHLSWHMISCMHNSWHFSLMDNGEEISLFSQRTVKLECTFNTLKTLYKHLCSLTYEVCDTLYNLYLIGKDSWLFIGKEFPLTRYIYFFNKPIPTSNSLRIVAASFVTNSLSMWLMTILFIPLGPYADLVVSASSLHAPIFL